MRATPPQSGSPQPVYIMQPVYLAPPVRGKSLWSMWLGFVLGLVALKSEPAGRGPAIAGVIMNGLVVLPRDVG